MIDELRQGTLRSRHGGLTFVVMHTTKVAAKWKARELLALHPGIQGNCACQQKLLQIWKPLDKLF
jgi:hypothetical protein